MSDATDKSVQPYNIEDFYIGRLIDKGSFSKVYAAKHKKTDFTCTIKMINKKLINKYKLHQQVREELINHRTVSSSKPKNQNILNLFTYFVGCEYLFIVTEIAYKGSLDKFIKEKKKLSEKTICNFFRQIVNGVKCTHENKIIHRDLKLANVLIDCTNCIKLGDFGSSIMLGDKEYIENAEPVGTLIYCAPEVLSRGKYHYSADCWSLGVILYEMFTNDTPFDDEKNEDIVKNIIRGEIPDKHNNEIPKLALDLIHKLLDLDIDARPTAAEILNHEWLC